MTETVSAYLGRVPDVDLTARLPADVAERVADLASVHERGDVARMAGRIIVRALDPTRAAREEAMQENDA